MIFHSLAIAINMRKPEIVLAGHEQIKGLLQELELVENMIVLDSLEFANELTVLMNGWQ